MGVITAVQFAVAMAIVLWPAGGWGRSGPQVEFIPAIQQKLEARPAPARETDEADSALSSKGYFKIGTIQGYLRERKQHSDAVMELESSILQQAAEAGGDVVRITPVPDDEAKEIVAGWKGAGRTGYFTFLKGTVWRYDSKTAEQVKSKAAVDRANFLATVDGARFIQGIEDGTLTLDDVKELIDANPSLLTAKASGGESPLHMAAKKGSVELVELLLAKGADINAQAWLWHGDTPLHTAAMYGQKDVVELLLARGVDVNIMNNYHETPMHEAVKFQKWDVAELLRQRGGHE
jgi:hypothetical protein